MSHRDTKVGKKLCFFSDIFACVNLLLCFFLIKSRVFLMAQQGSVKAPVVKNADMSEEMQAAALGAAAKAFEECSGEKEIALFIRKFFVGRGGVDVKFCR